MGLNSISKHYVSHSKQPARLSSLWGQIIGLCSPTVECPSAKVQCLRLGGLVLRNAGRMLNEDILSAGCTLRDRAGKLLLSGSCVRK